MYVTLPITAAKCLDHNDSELKQQQQRQQQEQQKILGFILTKQQLCMCTSHYSRDHCNYCDMKLPNFKLIVPVPWSR